MLNHSNMGSENMDLIQRTLGLRLTTGYGGQVVLSPEDLRTLLDAARGEGSSSEPYYGYDYVASRPPAKAAQEDNAICVRWGPRRDDATTVVIISGDGPVVVR